MQVDLRRVVALVVALAACGGAATTTATVEPLPAPTASAGATTTSAPSSPLACGHALPTTPLTPGPILPERTSVMAGQMTQEAATAKRLYDSERWAEAVTQLERVSSGQTGDDQGNRELAQYHLAVALYRAHRLADAARIFVEMARDRAHLKHAETILWIAKLVPQAPELVGTLAAYGPDEIARFNNPNQRELYWALSFFAGRERVERGARAEASAFFARVDAASEYAPLAQACAAQLH